MDKTANLRYQGPEQRSRKLPKSLSRVQPGYGTARRATTHATAGHIALQRKPAYPKRLRPSGEEAAGLRSAPGPPRPIALSRFDQLPVGVDPPPERGERLI